MNQHMNQSKDKPATMVAIVMGSKSDYKFIKESAGVLKKFGVSMSTPDLRGFDSLLSMVQMPAGIPVGTVAIGKAGAKNSAPLAISILALSDTRLRTELKAYRQRMRIEVETADAEIRNASFALDTHARQ